MKTLGAFIAAAVLVGAGTTQAASPLDKLDRLNQPEAPAKEQPRRQEVPSPETPPAPKPAASQPQTKLSLEPSEPTRSRSPEEIKKERAELDKELGDLLKK